MSRRPHSGKKTNLSQFGLLDIPDINDDDEPLDLSDDDFDLEAELAAISGGNKKPKPRKPAPVPVANLDAMVAESLKDVPSDDEEGSGDDDDPDLLNELQALTIDDEDAPPPPPRAARPAPPPPGGAPLSTDSSTISLLHDRITNYTVAEKNAKSNGESSRARRFNRGLKTLNDLLKQAKAGKPIKQEDIPPPVAVGKPVGAEDSQPAVPQREAPQAPPEMPLIDFGAPEPTPPEPNPPEPGPPEPSPPEPTRPGPGVPGPSIVMSKAEEIKQAELKIILDRKEEFKSAALSAKRRGNMPLALELLKVAKQFDVVVDAHNKGLDMNLDELPTVDMITRQIGSGKTEQESVQHSEAPVEDTSGGGLITAKTLKEGLQQRLEAFQKQAAKATEEGNSSKARRMNRIVKQYADAIKQHDRGAPVAVDELPTPAGYGPLPQDGAGSSAPPTRAAPAGVPAAAASRQQAALALLIKRHTMFKEAALYCKKKGDIESAKKYLRGAKAYEPCIEAARAGKPVDLTQLPKPPALADMEKRDSARAKPRREPSDRHQAVENPEDSDHDFTIVDADTHAETSSLGDGFHTLRTMLEAQITMTMNNVEHCRKIGNISEANMFKKMHDRAVEDLNILKVAKRKNNETPNFHYEMRSFTIVQCNTDLTDSDLELTIVRGIAYNVENPSEIDTYVKFEFPFPQEAPVSDRTSVVKNTNNPEYNAVFPLAIDRSRACQRVFKRHGIKFEVWSKGGWFRSDALLATAHVKLAPLQDKITLHESFPLMDGRRPVGGNLEVKLRVRTPILTQHIENSRHRWLLIDDVEIP